MIQQQQQLQQDGLRPSAQSLVHSEPAALPHSVALGGGASSLSTVPAVSASDSSSSVESSGGGGDGDGSASRSARTFAIVSGRGPAPNRASGGALAAFDAPRRVARIGAGAAAAAGPVASGATVAAAAAVGPLHQQQEQQEECKVQ